MSSLIIKIRGFLDVQGELTARLNCVKRFIANVRQQEINASFSRLGKSLEEDTIAGESTGQRRCYLLDFHILIVT